MSIAKITFFSLLAALTVSSAFASPYHMASTDLYIGTMTIRSTGSCKVKHTYENAQYGYILDAGNATIGHGILSSDGITVLALNNMFPDAYISGAYNSNSGVTSTVYFEDLSTYETLATIESLAPCSIRRLMEDSQSKNITKYNSKKLTGSIDVSYYFNGISPQIRTVNKDNYVDKAQRFSGKITFKGNKS